MPIIEIETYKVVHYPGSDRILRPLKLIPICCVYRLRSHKLDSILKT